MQLKRYFCRVTPAVLLMSWLQWHLPPILRAVPHKQIKQAPSLPVSPALYAHDTSSSFVICLSVPTAFLPWQPPGCHLYANTYMWLRKRKKKKKKEGKKTKQLFFLSQNKHCPAISPASPFPIRFGSPDWTWPPQRAAPAVSNHGLKADGDSEHRMVADGKRGTRPTSHGWTLAGKRIGREVQGKINTHTHTGG